MELKLNLEKIHKAMDENSSIFLTITALSIQNPSNASASDYVFTESLKNFFKSYDIQKS